MKKILLGVFFILSSIVFTKDTILVQGAMDIEVDTLVQALEKPQKEQVGAWTFWKGKIGDKDVIVSRTEVGIANAAASTTIGILKYSPTVIINQGTAGGHDPKLHAADIVLAKKIINMGAFRTEPKEYGIPSDQKDFLFFDVVQRIRDKEGNKVENESFSSDSKLMEIAKKINYKHGKVVEGTIGTADQWNRELERIKSLHEKYGTAAEEMETSSVALVAKAFDIPFMGIRVLSNSEHNKEDFNPDTAVWCQEFTIDFIKNIK
ncbi:5'-methylthioadenosine/S-adenosylhomocysteine nucleosidase [Fusobacterium sp.]|uniref:5'-methylthioadenosine/S-adenosylhomocysteine nucleosidase n=1 Tax=Fusobacterium sp. TaxID=68766 RepID=UPI00396CFD54